jgi:hypothetical protein
MALSDTVTTNLKEAESYLRNALSFAARQERPYVNSAISDMISQIDRLIKIDSIFDSIDDKIANNKNGQ